MECLEKLQVLKLQLGQMRDTISETRGSLLAETLNIDTHVRYDSKRFRFYVGSNPTDVANSVVNFGAMILEHGWFESNTTDKFITYRYEYN